MTMKHFWDDFRVKRKRQNMWKGKTNHVKRERPTACVVFKDNVFFSFSLALFLKTIETIETIFFISELSHLWYGISSRRPRRGRISITAGWAAEGSEACGPKNDGKIVLEEGEHRGFLHSLLVFALFEDVMLSCCETAGYVRFALFTSGYGYSPPSATLAWDNFHRKCEFIKYCLYCLYCL